MNLNFPSKITKISSNFLHQKQVEIFIKRDDVIHPIISGNKWRKLKYNFQAAADEGYDTILSFGGVFSNHLHALSYACNYFGFGSIGVVRDTDQKKETPTLSFCKKNKMKLYYLDRNQYRQKKSIHIINLLKKEFGKFYLIPEGGNNLLGLKGCQEIFDEIDIDYDYLCSPVGTGCTAAGLIKSMKNNKKFIGFAPFKKTIEQSENIKNFCDFKLYNNWELISDIHFGGFGKIDSNLIKFVRRFKIDFNMELDLIYTGKLFYSLFNMIKNNAFDKRTKILVIHTGGLQGLNGFNFSYS